MNTIFEINGFVGGITKRPAIIFVAQMRNGTAYVCEGGTIVNFTNEDVNEGVWIDELSDFDCFTASEPINTIEQFEEALND
jgi:hypothetical protein